MDDVEGFSPNWYSAPGKTIREAMKDRGIASKQLAESLGQPEKGVSDLLSGKLAIDQTIANGLAATLGGSVHFWLKREADFQSSLNRCAIRVDRNEGKAWLASIPARDMRQAGWVRPAADGDLLASCLAFFDVTTLEEWNVRYGREMKAVAFRTSKSHKSESGSVVSWLRYGELLSDTIDCRDWDPAAFAAALPEIKKLTRRKSPSDFLPRLQAICADSGVAVVAAKPPTGCPVSGATKFLSPSKAMILLSFRHLSDDQFWFTFFHEAGHLLLHSDKALFVERDDPGAMKEHEEDEANKFAFDMLIPTDLQHELRSIKLDLKSVLAFATKCGVAAGIVVGQLQHLGRLRHGSMNSVKRRYTWDEIAS